MGRVAVFCETWKSGGIESFLYNVLTNANESLSEIDIITTTQCNSIFTKELENRGARFVELTGNYRRFVKNLVLLKQIYSKNQYDIVYLNVCHGVAYIYAYLANRCGIKRVIVHSHNTDLRQGFGRKIKLFLHKLCVKLFESSGYEYWACSKDAAMFQFPKHAKNEEYTFIPNGIDIDRFSFDGDVRAQLREQLGLNSNFVIGNIGRLCDQKNQLFLVDLFSKLLKVRDDAYLILVGEGEFYPQIYKRIRELGISEKVNLYGVSNEVEKLLWAMDCFIFPSKFEGLGIVAIEAQAAGLSVICSERVPRETDITESISYVNLSEDDETWLAEITKIPIGKRWDNRKEIKLAGFDINDVSNKIMKELLQNETKG